MGPGEFTVRITAEGRIIFDMAGLSQEEIRLQREAVEAMIGKIIAEGSSAEPPAPGHVATHATPESDEEKRVRGRS